MFKEVQGRMRCVFCGYMLSAMIGDNEALPVCECDEAQAEANAERTVKLKAETDKTQTAIDKGLKGVYGNPDVLFCITTGDVLASGIELGVALTLEDVRRIGARAFKHYSSEDLMMNIADCVEEHIKESKKVLDTAKA
jgi:hypothetical protein